MRVGSGTGESKTWMCATSERSRLAKLRKLFCPSARRAKPDRPEAEKTSGSCVVVDREEGLCERACVKRAADGRERSSGHTGRTQLRTVVAVGKASSRGRAAQRWTGRKTAEQGRMLDEVFCSTMRLFTIAIRANKMHM